MRINVFPVRCEDSEPASAFMKQQQEELPMQLIDISFIDGLNFILWLIASFGLSKIFKKFNIEGWWAFIPGARIYWLGRCADREEDGKIAMIFEILTYPILLAGQVINYDLEIAK